MRLSKNVDENTERGSYLVNSMYPIITNNDRNVARILDVGVEASEVTSCGIYRVNMSGNRYTRCSTP